MTSYLCGWARGDRVLLGRDRNFGRLHGGRSVLPDLPVPPKIVEDAINRVLYGGSDHGIHRPPRRRSRY
ncbi:MAG: hypothetical protein VKJ24_16380 [Synechococcales bacterium]|nr:hypothetical protein [Synechococcales bacterium]